MKTLIMIAMLGGGLLIIPVVSYDQEIDLTGLWQSKSGFVYRFSQNGENFQGILVRFGSLERELNEGLPPAFAHEIGVTRIGDTRFVGRVTGGSIRMSINVQLPVRFRSTCPDIWSSWSRENWGEMSEIKISSDGATISGWRAVYEIYDSCRVARRGHREEVFERWPALSAVEIVTPGDLKPIDEIAIGQSFRVRLTFAEDPSTEITETVTIRTSRGSAQKVRVTGNSRVIVSEPILVAPSGQ